MFDEVIVPVDGSLESARALAPAIAIADYLETPITVVAYHSPHSDGFDLSLRVRRQVDEFGDFDCPIEIAPMKKPVAELLKEAVDRAPGALLVMTTRGHGRTAAVIGSVATAVLASSHRPVLLIGPECDVGQFRFRGRLVVATDASPCTRPALELAARLTEMFDFEPVVVNVIDPTTSRALQRAQSDQLGNDIQLESGMVRRFAQDLGWSIGETSVEFQVLHANHAGKEIAKRAGEMDAAAIVMATHARTGLRRFAVGSVTAEVVAHAPCPVFAIAPEIVED